LVRKERKENQGGSPKKSRAFQKKPRGERRSKLPLINQKLVVVDPGSTRQGNLSIELAKRKDKK